MKRPAFQFYPADWRKHLELQSCSIAARGLWHEMMCVMHEAQPYGYLVLNGKPMTDVQAATACRVTPRDYRALLAELNAVGVPGLRADGAIFSRRMVKDEQLRNERASGGPKGAEHGAKGASHGSKGGRPRKATGDKKPPLVDSETPPLKPPPSSSSSASASAYEETTSPLSGLPPDGALPRRPKVNGELKAERLTQMRRDAVEIISFLNERARKKFEPVKANIDLIVARLRDGATVDQVRAVIEQQCIEWNGNPEMGKYLRPETLFNATKYAGYVGHLGDDPQNGTPRWD